MKVQYFGDVNDYRKFALLRLLAGVDQFKMLTEADDSGQGRNRRYLEQRDRWRGYDSMLFDALSKGPDTPTTEELQRVENEALIPRATFFNDLTPDALSLEAVSNIDVALAQSDGDMSGFEFYFRTLQSLLSGYVSQVQLSWLVVGYKVGVSPYQIILGALLLGFALSTTMTSMTISLRPKIRPRK